MPATRWSVEEQKKRALLKQGVAVAVNLRRHGNPDRLGEGARPVVPVDRATPWGNPFVLGRDGDRAIVIARYPDDYLPRSPGLLARHRELWGSARVVCFQVLSGRGVRTVQALAATSVFPLGWTAIGWLRSRRLDAIAAISLVLIAIGLIISLASGNAHFYLVRESVLSAAFGLGFLGTLLLPRRPCSGWAASSRPAETRRASPGGTASGSSKPSGAECA
jgi:hypothetical protein